jgi:hypothetical protein
MAKIQKDIKDMNEIELYFLIEECGYFCWRMNHDMANGRIPRKDHAAIDADIVTIKKKQREAIDELPRVGVESPLDESGRPTDNYWVWYRKWHAWHHNMSDESWSAVSKMLSSGGITDVELSVFRKDTESFVPGIKAELERQKAALTTMEKS